MSSKISVLYIAKDVHPKLLLNDNLDSIFLSHEDLSPLFEQEDAPKSFDVVIIENMELLSEFESIESFITPYRFLYTTTELELPETVQQFLFKKKARKVEEDELDKLLENLEDLFFGHQAYGDKKNIQELDVSSSFTGSVHYSGFHQASFSGNFGNDWTPLVSWGREYQFVGIGKTWEIWLEYELEGNCEFQLILQYIPNGETKRFARSEVYSMDDLKQPIQIKENDFKPNIQCSIQAKGNGIIKIGALHFRESRKEMGVFFPGGKRLIDSKRQEMFCYFHPGDLKPPLNVYFAGYHSREGFEAYYMMESLGAPFLLISDPCLEGGSFYQCSKEMEEKILQVIQETLDELGFTHEQLTMAGFSMGTFGACYYGFKLDARAIVIGKPLFNLGTIALNGQTIRPNQFNTMLDIVQLMTNKTTKEAALALDQHFFNSLKEAKITNLLIAIGYMKNDDYDHSAYYDLMEHIQHHPIRVISKGIVGRHNDNTDGIIIWCIHQYKRMMTEFFERG